MNDPAKQVPQEAEPPVEPLEAGVASEKFSKDVLEKMYRQKEAEDGDAFNEKLDEELKCSSHPAGLLVAFRELAKDPEKCAEVDRIQAKWAKRKLQREFVWERRFDGLPAPSRFELELLDLYYDQEISSDLDYWYHSHRISDDLRDKYLAVYGLKDSIAKLMREKAALTDERILEFENSAKVEPLVEAVRCQLTPGQYLELMKTTEPEKFVEAIGQYRPQV